MFTLELDMNSELNLHRANALIALQKQKKK